MDCVSYAEQLRPCSGDQQMVNRQRVMLVLRRSSAAWDAAVAESYRLV